MLLWRTGCQIGERDPRKKPAPHSVEVIERTIALALYPLH